MGIAVVMITNQNFGRLYKNDNEKCQRCKHDLIVGSKAVRKRGTHGKQKWYHAECFERLYH